MAQYGGYGGTLPSPESDKGLVVELPDGKLFKLKNPNGRVVEMPNSAVVEMLDGQVVEVRSFFVGVVIPVYRVGSL
jgi:hypothetical protein